MAIDAGAGAPPDRPRDAHRARPSATVTCVILPNDLQERCRARSRREQHGTRALRRRLHARRVIVPATTDLRARRRRAQRRRARSRCWSAPARCDATDEVIEVADQLGAGVAKALLGKAVLPDDLPWVTGSIGLLGTEPSWDLMMDCDTLLMVGSSFPYSEFLPQGGPGARRADRHRRPACSACAIRWRSTCVGDAARDAARAAAAALQRKADRAWREEIEEDVARLVEGARRPRACTTADPVNPQRVFWELSPRLPDGAILTVRLRLGGELVRARPRRSGAA